MRTLFPCFLLLLSAVPAFAQEPEPVPTFEVELSWTIPTMRTDGSPLPISEIAGYNIYYGTSEGAYPNNIFVDGGQADQFIVSELAMLSATTYYFVVTTVDTNGLESRFSNPVSKATPNASPPGEPALMNVIIRLNVGSM